MEPENNERKKKPKIKRSEQVRKLQKKVKELEDFHRQRAEDFGKFVLEIQNAVEKRCQEQDKKFMEFRKTMDKYKRDIEISVNLNKEETRNKESLEKQIRDLQNAFEYSNDRTKKYFDGKDRSDDRSFRELDGLKTELRDFKREVLEVIEKVKEEVKELRNRKIVSNIDAEEEPVRKKRNYDHTNARDLNSSSTRKNKKVRESRDSKYNTPSSSTTGRKSNEQRIDDTFPSRESEAKRYSAKESVREKNRYGFSEEESDEDNVEVDRPRKTSFSSGRSSKSSSSKREAYKEYDPTRGRKNSNGSSSVKSSKSSKSLKFRDFKRINFPPLYVKTYCNLSRKENFCVVFHGVPRNSSEKDIQEMLRGFGVIKNVDCAQNTAYVTYETKQGVYRVFKRWDGRDLKRNILQLEVDKSSFQFFIEGIFFKGLMETDVELLRKYIFGEEKIKTFEENGGLVVELAESDVNKGHFYARLIVKLDGIRLGGSNIVCDCYPYVKETIQKKSNWMVFSDISGLTNKEIKDEIRSKYGGIVLAIRRNESSFSSKERDDVHVLFDRKEILAAVRKKVFGEKTFAGISAGCIELELKQGGEQNREERNNNNNSYPRDNRNYGHGSSRDYGNRNEMNYRNNNYSHGNRDRNNYIGNRDNNTNNNTNNNNNNNNSRRAEFVGSRYQRNNDRKRKIYGRRMDNNNSKTYEDDDYGVPTEKRVGDYNPSFDYADDKGDENW